MSNLEKFFGRIPWHKTVIVQFGMSKSTIAETRSNALPTELFRLWQKVLSWEPDYKNKMGKW